MVEDPHFSVQYIWVWFTCLILRRASVGWPAHHGGCVPLGVAGCPPLGPCCGLLGGGGLPPSCGGPLRAGWPGFLPGALECGGVGAGGVLFPVAFLLWVLSLNPVSVPFAVPQP